MKQIKVDKCWDGIFWWGITIGIVGATLYVWFLLYKLYKILEWAKTL